MGHHQDRGPVLADLFHPPVAFSLKEHIAYRKSLVHDQDLRLHIDRQGKGQPHEHTAGIGLHRLVYKIPDLREIQDIAKLLVHLLFGIAHHGPVHIDVLDPGIIHIEAGPQLQQGGDLPIHRHLALGGREHTGDDLQYGGFP